MKFYFTFNSATHDFWPVYDAIKTYYPIGIQESVSSLYFDYEGQKKLGKLILDNIHDPKNFKERFLDFSELVQNQFGLEVQDTTSGQQPLFSLELILEKTEYPGLIKIKKLCLGISLLGDFYTIFGINETIVIGDQKPYPHHYHAVNAVTASPVNDFEQPYLDLKKAVQERYPNHKQIPFAVLTSYMHGLYSKYGVGDECMVYNALFDQKLTTDYLFQQQGDRYYANDEWLKEGVDLSEMKSVEVIVMPPPPPSGIGNQ